MKIYNTLYFLFLFFYLNACSTSITHDSFNSKQLVSSKGEKIYINSINWGVTGDYQCSVISKDSLRLKNRNDTVGSIPGLDPFMYQFKNDSLILYFYDRVKYRVPNDLNTITVIYKVVSDSEYLKLKEKTGCFSVPIS